MNEKILVVEDEKEIADLIRDYLTASNYKVVIAHDGEAGLELFESEKPQLAILDIMLPKKDGFEVCRTIRSKSNIPILMLSAKKEDTDKIIGLGLGADDYITKPFSVAYLKARIQNLMKQRERLHSIYSNLLPGEVKMQPRPNLIAQIDEQFMDDVLAIIKENLDNNEFSVEELVRLIGLSRTTFYNKMKSLTGMSPVEFIRDHRLSHAAILITTEQLLVKEICYMTGFSDLKYFGKCFKTKYGMSPSKYRDMHKN